MSTTMPTRNEARDRLLDLLDSVSDGYGKKLAELALSLRMTVEYDAETVDVLIRAYDMVKAIKDGVDKSSDNRAYDAENRLHF